MITIEFDSDTQQKEYSALRAHIREDFVLQSQYNEEEKQQRKSISMDKNVELQKQIDILISVCARIFEFMKQKKF